MEAMIVDSNQNDALYTLGLIKQIYPDVNVTFARTLFDSKRMISEKEYDLVITELKLSGDSGYRVVKMVKTFSPKTRVAIMTSSSFGIDCFLAIELGADEIFVKSIRPGNSKEFLNYLKDLESDDYVHVREQGKQKLFL